jgi:hypothetical protein
MSKRDGSFPDTLFIGRHDEFPRIELPAVIENTRIRIAAPAQAESLKTGEHFTYLNIFGWFSGEQVEFLVVNFKQGMRHWPDGRDDCHLYYSISAGQTEWSLDSLGFQCTPREPPLRSARSRGDSHAAFVFAPPEDGEGRDQS